MIAPNVRGKPSAQAKPALTAGFIAMRTKTARSSGPPRLSFPSRPDFPSGSVYDRSLSWGRISRFTSRALTKMTHPHGHNAPSRGLVVSCDGLGGGFFVVRMLSICIDGYGIVLPSCSVSGMSGLCFHYIQPSLKSSFTH